MQVTILKTNEPAIVNRSWKEPSGMCYTLIDIDGNPIYNRSLRTFYEKEIVFTDLPKKKSNQLEIKF